MTTYTYPTPNSSLKSMALAALGSSGLIVPTLYNNHAWSFVPSGLTETGASGVGLASGYSAAASDASGVSWSTQVSGSLVKVVSGGVATAYTMASGIFEGVAYSPGLNAAYVLNSSGVLGVVSGASVVAVTQGFGNTPSIRLTASGSSLFTLIPSAGMGTFALSSLTSGTSGLVAFPFDVPTCIAASTTVSAVAVGGFNYSSVTSGFTAIADAPNDLTIAGVQSGTGIVAAVGKISGSWTVTSTVSGLGAPKFLGWAPTGTNLLVSDPTNNHVYSLTYALGNLTLTQTLTVSGASALAVMANSDRALICQPALNTITPFTLSGTWSSGATFAIGSPTAVISTGASGAIIGCSSGLAIASMSSGGTWSITSTGAVGFTPGYLARDSSGNIYAAGTSGASGIFAVATSGLTVTGSGSFVGSVSGLVYSQGQLALADAVNAYVRFYGLLNSAWTQQATGAAVVGLDSIAYAATSNDFFAAGSAKMVQYNFIAPFTVSQNKTGVVSVYALGSFTSLTLSASAVPQAITWDPSGNVSLVTLQNTLFTVTSGATLVGSSGISQQINQPSTTPIGVSSLVWVNGALYGSSSLCDALIQIK